MPVKKDVGEALKELGDKIDSLKKDFQQLKDFEEKVGKTVEEKVFEIKAVTYLILVIVIILLFLALGALMKAIGF